MDAAKAERERERMAMMLIDWHDFSVVRTIEFDASEDLHALGKPVTKEMVVQMNKASTQAAGAPLVAAAAPPVLGRRTECRLSCATVQRLKRTWRWRQKRQQMMRQRQQQWSMTRRRVLSLPRARWHRHCRRLWQHPSPQLALSSLQTTTKTLPSRCSPEAHCSYLPLAVLCLANHVQRCTAGCTGRRNCEHRELECAPPARHEATPSAADI